MLYYLNKYLDQYYCRFFRSLSNLFNYYCSMFNCQWTMRLWNSF